MEIDGLDNPERAKLLGIVDKFRAIGISDEISLPQLVVVGDQSSGKSSLLEGLTGLSFPTDNGLCTRFATQIILRRSEKSQAKVSILPGSSAVKDPKRKKALELFRPRIGEEGLVGPKFIEILDQAAVAMGLPPSTQKTVEHLEKRFSDDVLSIELSGPEHHHLSVVDVPGLFHNPTPTQTQGDLDTIRALIEGYMENERTIILAVMNATNNLANQEVFSLAEKHDKEGKRTVGVITKCDVVGSGDEKAVIEVAQNKSTILHHGWFAVRNRSTEEIRQGVTIKQRHDREEEFFKKGPWSALARSRVGIPAMRTHLAQLLYDHIRLEFPQLVKEIRIKLLDTRQRIAAMGESRDTVVDQRRYLTRIATQYQADNTDALKGSYKSGWKSKDPRKIRMHIALENDWLARTMALKGHKYHFKEVDDGLEEDIPKEFGKYGLGDLEKGEDSSSDFALGPEHHDDDDSRDDNDSDDDDDDDDDEDDDDDDDQSNEVHLEIYSWVRDRYRTSRGAELPGTVNPAVLESLFRQQAEQWGPIAKGYTDSVKRLVLRHNERSLKQLIQDVHIRQGVSDLNRRAAEEAHDLATARLDSLLEDEMDGILQTANHYFADNLAANRRDRLLIRLKKFFGQNGTKEDGTVTQLGWNLDQMITKTHLSNEDSAVYDIHDILKAYYKVAMKRFIDNVVVQVTERHYLGALGPLRYFSPAYVGGLSDQELSNLAGESRATTMERERLSTLLSQLERALKLGEGRH